MAANNFSAEELDRKFDAGEDISEYIDWSQAKRPGREDLARMIHQLQETKGRLLEEARRIDESLQTLQGKVKQD